MVNNLLPWTYDVDFASYHEVSGIQYILDRVENLHRTIGLNRRHRKDLDETLNLILINVVRFAKQKDDVARAKSLMRSLDLGG